MPSRNGNIRQATVATASVGCELTRRVGRTPPSRPRRMTIAAPAALRHRAGLLAWATIVWNAIEAVVAIGAGTAAGSGALIGFGLDSTVEVSAAVVALWYSRGEDDAREDAASKLIAVSFFALAGYVTLDAVVDLVQGNRPDESTVGMVLAVLSTIVMPVLAAAKRRTGQALGIRALIAEAAEIQVCAYLSVVLMVGLGVNATLGWWWADLLSALGIAALAANEGREAWRGEDCC